MVYYIIWYKRNDILSRVMSSYFRLQYVGHYSYLSDYIILHSTHHLYMYSRTMLRARTYDRLMPTLSIESSRLSEYFYRTQV